MAFKWGRRSSHLSETKQFQGICENLWKSQWLGNSELRKDPSGADLSEKGSRRNQTAFGPKVETLGSQGWSKTEVSGQSQNHRKSVGSCKDSSLSSVLWITMTSWASIKLPEHLPRLLPSHPWLNRRLWFLSHLLQRKVCGKGKSGSILMVPS